MKGEHADLDLIGADIVEVAPAYDHAEITAIAAAHVGYELLAIFARRSGGKVGDAPRTTAAKPAAVRQK